MKNQNDFLIHSFEDDSPDRCHATPWIILASEAEGVWQEGRMMLFSYVSCSFLKKLFKSIVYSMIMIRNIKENKSKNQYKAKKLKRYNKISIFKKI